MKKILLFISAVLCAATLHAGAPDGYSKHVSVSQLPLRDAKAAQIAPRYMQLPGESPFYTAADFFINTPDNSEASMMQSTVSPYTLNVPSPLPIFNFCTLYDPLWQTEGVSFSLQSYDPNTNQITTVINDQTFYAKDMALVAGEKMYTSVGLTNGWTLRYLTDLTTLRHDDTYASAIQINALSAVYDRTTNTAYVCRVNDEGTGYVLSTFDIATGECGEPMYDYGTIGLAAMGATKRGLVVGLLIDGTLVSIDKTTGAPTQIAKTGLTSSYATAGVCDPTRDIFYFAQYAAQGTAIYAIDVISGQKTLVKRMPRGIQLTGLYIPYIEAGEGMPAEPTDLALNFTDDNLNGSLTFKLPATLFGDEAAPADGTLEYEVYLNGILYHESTGSYGEEIELPMTLDKRGLYTVRIKACNDAGYGNPVTVEKYIGYDDVTDVTNATMQLNGTTFKIDWKAVEPLHGGYINRTHISYDVIRYPDATKVAEGLTDTSFECSADGLPEDAYIFGIVANYYDPDAATIAQKPEVRTNTRVYGAFSTPIDYSIAANPIEAADIFTVENTNTDATKWQFSQQGAVILSNAAALNDWFFTMPIHLKGHTIYNFTAHAGTASATERIEVKAGMGANSAAMTLSTVEPTEMNGEKLLSGNIISTDEGVYYIGFHAMSDAGGIGMYVQDFTLTEGGSSEAPGIPTNYTLTAYYEGSLEQFVAEFNAPDVTASGTPLTEITKIEVRLNGNLISTIENPTPGARQKVQESIVNRGTQTVSVAAINNAGAGMEISSTVFVGFGDPQSPTVMNSRISQSDVNTISLWWPAITHDVYGRRIPRTVWYQPMIIFPNTGQSTAGNGLYSAPGFTYSGVHDRYHVVNPEYDAEQNDPFFVRLYFSTYYYEGTGLWEGPTHHASGIPFSKYISVGRAETLPWADSFRNSYASHIFMLEDETGDGAFYLDKTCTNPSAQSFDGDDGMLIFTPTYYNETAYLISSRIDLTKAVIPELSFYYYAVPGSFDRIFFNAGDGYDYTDIITVELGETMESGWTKVTADMSKFRGKYIQLGIGATGVTGMGSILIDKIEITDPDIVNLSVGSIDAPATARANRPINISVPVTNQGHDDVMAYTATLYVNNEAVETKTCDPIGQGVTRSISFIYTPRVTHTEGLAVHIAIELADDEFAEDNTSDEAIIEVVMPGYPAVQDLVAEASGDNEVALSWSRPSGVGDVVETISDDIETYTAFSTGLQSSALGEDDYVGNWTIIDADKLPVICVANTAFPNNPLIGGDSTPKAWMVYNNDKSNIPANFANDLQPHSGNQCFVCPAAVPEDNTNGNDDWLISPLLSGKAQTVNFFAKAQSTVYGQERFEVLYSTTDTDIDSFTLIETYNVDDQWHSINANLPEGAKYFAIRCTSYDAWVLMVDDITYEAGADESLQLSGFNVYRNRNLLVTEPVNDCTFVENDVEEGVHDYHVSAVYNLGESALSNTATVDLTKSGLDSITVGDITVAADNHAVVVTGADGLDISITAADGKIIAATVGSTENRIPVATPGVYLVKVGNLTVKVAVK